MDQHVAPAQAVDQFGGHQAAQGEQQGDGDGAKGRPVTGQLQCLQHFGGKRVDGEQRHDRAGPEQGDEGHALAVTGVEQRPHRHRFVAGLLWQVGNGVVWPVDFLDHGVGFGGSAFA